MTDRAPYFRRGQRLSARGLNRLGTLAERGARLKVIGPNIRLVDTPMGKVIVARATEEQRGMVDEVRRFGVPYRLLATGPDWLRCESMPAGEIHYVLKPWELRRSSFNNVTRNGVLYKYEVERDDRRSAIWIADPEKMQREIIVQPYVSRGGGYAGDVIVVLSHSPVSVAVPDPEAPDGEPMMIEVGRVDLNLAAREFVREADLELE